MQQLHTASDLDEAHEDGSLGDVAREQDDQLDGRIEVCRRVVGFVGDEWSSGVADDGCEGLNVVGAQRGVDLVEGIGSEDGNLMNGAKLRERLQRQAVGREGSITDNSVAIDAAHFLDGSDMPLIAGLRQAIREKTTYLFIIGHADTC